MADVPFPAFWALTDDELAQMLVALESSPVPWFFRELVDALRIEGAARVMERERAAQTALEVDALAVYWFDY